LTEKGVFGENILRFVKFFVILFVQKQFNGRMNKKELRTGILNAVTDYLHQEGFHDIRADLGNMNKPKKIVEERSGDIFQPDMMASQEDSSFLFEIETGENLDANNELFVRKCKLFQQYADSKNGKLYLIVPIQYFRKVLTHLNRNNLKHVGILQVDAG